MQLPTLPALSKPEPQEDPISIFNDSPHRVKLSAWRMKMGRDVLVAWAKPVAYSLLLGTLIYAPEVRTVINEWKQARATVAAKVPAVEPAKVAQQP